MPSEAVPAEAWPFTVTIVSGETFALNKDLR